MKALKYIGLALAAIAFVWGVTEGIAAAKTKAAAMKNEPTPVLPNSPANEA